MARCHHFAEVAAEREAVHEQEGDDHANPGEEQHEIEGKRDQIIDKQPQNGSQPEREAGDQPDRPGAQGCLGIMPGLDQADDAIHVGGNHADRDCRKKKPEEQRGQDDRAEAAGRGPELTRRIADQAARVRAIERPGEQETQPDEDQQGDEQRSHHDADQPRIGEVAQCQGKRSDHAVLSTAGPDGSHPGRRREETPPLREEATASLVPALAGYRST